MATGGGINQISIPVLLQFITLVAPYFLASFFVLLSIINGDIKGFMYLFGVFIVYGIIALLKNSIPSQPAVGICSVLESFHGNQHPSFITGLYTYTLVYILIPMIMYKVFNAQLIVLLSFIIIVDILIRSVFMGCISFVNIFFGVIIGGLIGILWVFMLRQSGQTKLLFYDEILSNRETCSRPSEDKFTCDVYQHGKIIGHSVGRPPQAQEPSSETVELIDDGDL
jgi:hypothetical protein